MIFKKVPVSSEDARSMLQRLNNALVRLIGHTGEMHVDLTDFETERSCFVVGYEEGEPVCCAGIRCYDENTGEVKRVYAGKNTINAGARLMEELERLGTEYGYGVLLIECRTNNFHALEFYRNCGYSVCDNFPPYVGDDTAVCMMKTLN